MFGSTPASLRQSRIRAQYKNWRRCHTGTFQRSWGTRPEAPREAAARQLSTLRPDRRTGSDTPHGAANGFQSPPQRRSPRKGQCAAPSSEKRSRLSRANLPGGLRRAANSGRTRYRWKLVNGRRSWCGLLSPGDLLLRFLHLPLVFPNLMVKQAGREVGSLGLEPRASGKH